VLSRTPLDERGEGTGQPASKRHGSNDGEHHRQHAQENGLGDCGAQRAVNNVGRGRHTGRPPGQSRCGPGQINVLTFVRCRAHKPVRRSRHDGHRLSDQLLALRAGDDHAAPVGQDAIPAGGETLGQQNARERVRRDRPCQRDGSACCRRNAPGDRDEGDVDNGPGHRAGDEEGLRRENTVQPFDVVGARQRAVGGKASIQMLLSILVDNRQPALVGLEELLGRRTESCVVPIAKLRTGYESIQPGHGGSGLSILGE
jgi:hypothetical protein